MNQPSIFGGPPRQLGATVTCAQMVYETGCIDPWARYRSMWASMVAYPAWHAGGDIQCDPPRQPTVNPYAEERAKAEAETPKEAL